jgi:uncharacterized protein with HEPN domain
LTDDDLKQLLLVMLQAAREAVIFLASSTEDGFHDNVMAQRAVTMCLHTIGECAAKVADRHPAFADRHPVIPFVEMRGMRNRIAHGYAEINFHTVWLTVKHDLPLLVTTLETILATFPDNQA